jgi:predicted ferric reductase
MGASIYVGTFLLGNNWDYRLAFLVLLVPQLVEWMHSFHRMYRVAAWMSIILVLLSCWHLWIVQMPPVPLLYSEHDPKRFWMVLDEVFNWMLFASLAYLLVASMPEWVKELARSILPKHGPKKFAEQNVH